MKHQTFNWRGTPSAIGKTLIKVSGTGAPAKNHPLRKGLAAPKKTSFCIPSREQAQADTDKRHALRKGGI
jgi:hypothetical protein